MERDQPAEHGKAGGGRASARQRSPRRPHGGCSGRSARTAPRFSASSSGVRGGSQARGVRRAVMERGGTEQTPAGAPQVRSAALSGFLEEGCGARAALLFAAGWALVGLCGAGSSRSFCYLRVSL